MTKFEFIHQYSFLQEGHNHFNTSIHFLSNDLFCKIGLCFGDLFRSKPLTREHFFQVWEQIKGNGSQIWRIFFFYRCIILVKEHFFCFFRWSSFFAIFSSKRISWATSRFQGSGCQLTVFCRFERDLTAAVYSAHSRFDSDCSGGSRFCPLLDTEARGLFYLAKTALSRFLLVVPSMCHYTNCSVDEIVSFSCWICGIYLWWSDLAWNCTFKQNVCLKSHIYWI